MIHVLKVCLFLKRDGLFFQAVKEYLWAPVRMRLAVRKNDVLNHIVGSALCVLCFTASVFAQTPPKEAFPFDWLRPDAPPTNRTLSPAVFPTPQDIPLPTPPEEAPPAVDGAPPHPQVAPVAASPLDPEIAPAALNSAQAAARPKPRPVLNEIEVTNARILTLVEFRLVASREESKPLVLKPALQTGKSLRVEVPMAMGCAFTVHLEFTDGTPEQHDGINLCNDKKLNLIE